MVEEEFLMKQLFLTQTRGLSFESGQYFILYERLFTVR